MPLLVHAPLFYQKGGRNVNLETTAAGADPEETKTDGAAAGRLAAVWVLHEEDQNKRIPSRRVFRRGVQCMPEVFEKMEEIK